MNFQICEIHHEFMHFTHRERLFGMSAATQLPENGLQGSFYFTCGVRPSYKRYAKSAHPTTRTVVSRSVSVPRYTLLARSHAAAMPGAVYAEEHQLVNSFLY